MRNIFKLILAVIPIVGFSQVTTTTPTTPAPPAVATTAKPAEKEWDISLSGFIRTDYIWDTRKNVNVREDQLNLYPLDEVLDKNGDDVNATDASNFLSITSRLAVKVKGPDVWGAKMSGTLEGDFFGNTEGSPSSIGMFRLRHAFVNMEWTKTSLTMGQTWYPAFVPEVFPGVANFNTGIMFNPFGWATQVRLKQNFTKEVSFAVTAYKEREFTVPGPGTQNAASINSALPTFHGQLQFKNAKWVAGIGAEVKSMQPLTDNGGTTTATRLSSNEKVNSTSFLAYLKYSNDKFYVKAYGISGSDMNNLVMLGGYMGYTTTGQVEKYEATKTDAYWLEIASNGKGVAPGLFFGYTTNNGNGKNGLAVGETAKYYMRGISGSRIVDNVWRLSGRIDFKKNKFKVTPEIEYTNATWADLNTKANGEAGGNHTTVSNVRALISCSYTF